MTAKEVKRGVVLPSDDDEAEKNYLASVQRGQKTKKADGATYGPHYGKRQRRAGIKLNRAD